MRRNGRETPVQVQYRFVVASVTWTTRDRPAVRRAVLRAWKTEAPSESKAKNLSCWASQQI